MAVWRPIAPHTIKQTTGGYTVVALKQIHSRLRSVDEAIGACLRIEVHGTIRTNRAVALQSIEGENWPGRRENVGCVGWNELGDRMKLLTNVSKQGTDLDVSMEPKLGSRTRKVDFRDSFLLHSEGSMNEVTSTSRRNVD